MGEISSKRGQKVDAQSSTDKNVEGAAHRKRASILTDAERDHAPHPAHSLQSTPGQDLLGKGRKSGMAPRPILAFRKETGAIDYRSIG